MTDLAVIILVGREELHIGRCLDRLLPLEPRQILIVESQKGDRTHEIVEEWKKSKSGIPVKNIWHDWPGTQAAQFNWALDNLSITEKWILRLDADEYLTSETVDKLKHAIASKSYNGNCINGLTLELRRRFCGGNICHATNGIRQVRVFRRGKARYLETAMDERLIVDGGVEDFDGAFYDDSLLPMSEWRRKHRGYARREAQQAIEGTSQDPRKSGYYRLPPYFRAFAYFCVRYFLKGGFLDGYAGWMWNFWQGLWYRCLVDYEIGKLKRAR